jgi:hypothetical protein
LKVDRWGRLGSGKAGVPTRRTIIKSLALGLGAIAAGPDLTANAADNSRLIERVVAVCGRLGRSGGGSSCSRRPAANSTLARRICGVSSRSPWGASIGPIPASATSMSPPPALSTPAGSIAGRSTTHLPRRPSSSMAMATNSGVFQPSHVYGGAPPTIEELHRRGYRAQARQRRARAALPGSGRSSRFTTRAPATSPALMKRGHSTSASGRAASRPMWRCR